MREFVSLEALSRIWHVEQAEIRKAADAAGVLLFTLHGRTHADKNNVKQIGDALFAKADT